MSLFNKKVKIRRSKFVNVLMNKRYMSIYVPRALTIGDMEFEDPPTDPQEWFVTKDESYIPDKQAFIVGRFKKNFTSVEFADMTDEEAYDFIGRLASRSSRITEWLAKNNAEYAAEAQLPLYFKGLISADSFGQLQKNVTSYNKEVAAEQKEKQAAADKYKKELDAITKKFEASRKSKIGVDPFLKVLTIPSTKLPLTLIASIENYTQTGDDAPEPKAYAREMLIRFKIELIKRINQDKTFDVDKFINDNMGN